MDGLRLVDRTMLELDRRGCIQRFDLDAVIATDGHELHLREQGRFSRDAASIELRGVTLAATVRSRDRRASRRLTINLEAVGIIDNELGIVGVPQELNDAGCQTVLPLSRRSVAKGKVPPDLLIDLDLAEAERLPLWTACNTSEQLALRHLGLAERELIREQPRSTPRILLGWLDGDKAKPAKLRTDKRGYLRNPSALVTGAPCLYSLVFETAWSVICELASDSESARHGFVRRSEMRVGADVLQCAVNLRNAVEHLRRAAKNRATQRLRDDARGTDNERTRQRRHAFERRLVDLADEISALIDKHD